MNRPCVLGVLETAIYVADLSVSQAFYEKVLGCVVILHEEGRLRALRIPGNQVLLLFAVGQSTTASSTPGGTIPAHDGRGQLHLAFEIEKGQLEAWRQYLRETGIAIESEVSSPLGGHSIYFRDPDQHLLELVTRDCWDLH